MWALLLIDRWDKQDLPQALRFFTNFGRRYVPPLGSEIALTDSQNASLLSQQAAEAVRGAREKWSDYAQSGSGSHE
jgi:hypothetical protein